MNRPAIVEPVQHAFFTAVHAGERVFSDLIHLTHGWGRAMGYFEPHGHGLGHCMKEAMQETGRTLRHEMGGTAVDVSKFKI